MVNEEREEKHKTWFLPLDSILMRIKTTRPSKITIGKTWLESCATTTPPAIVGDDFTTFVREQFILFAIYFNVVCILSSTYRFTCLQ
jgi:hypothetical protein